MRKEYYLCDEDFEKLMEAAKPTPVMYLSGGRPMCNSPQENANAAWCELGKRLGFDGMSVQASSKGERWFSAEETQEAWAARLDSKETG